MPDQYVQAADLEMIVRALSARLRSLETRDPSAGIGRDIAFGLPTVTQGAATATLSAIDSRYTRVGKWAFVFSMFQFTNAGSAGNAINVDLPTTVPAPQTGVIANWNAVGSFLYLRTGIGFHAGTATFFPGMARRVVFFVGSNTSDLGNTPSFAFANTDVLSMTLAYPAQ